MYQILKYTRPLTRIYSKFEVSSSISLRKFSEQPEPNQQNFKEKIDINRRASIKEIDDLLTNKTFITSPNNTSFLFECIANYLPEASQLQKSVLINKLWRMINEKDDITEEDYVDYLRARRLIKEPVLENLRDFLKNVKISSPLLYEEVFFLASSCGSPADALGILGEMKEKRFNVTERVFNALIVAHSRNKDLSNVEAVYDTMISANLTPSSETKTELINAYLANGAPEKVVKLLAETEFTTEQLIDILKNTLHQNYDKTLVTKIMGKFSKEIIHQKGISPTFRNLFLELIHIRNRPRQVVEVLEFLPSSIPLESESDDNYAGFLIMELFKTNQPFEEIIHLCSFLNSSNRNTRAFHIAAEHALKVKSGFSLDLLKELSKTETLKPHYFWPLIIENFSKNGEQGIIEMIKEMKDLKVELDSDTFKIYILPKLSIVLKNLREGLKILTKAGVQMSEMTDALLPLLILQGRYGDFLYVINTYPSKFNSSVLAAPLVKTLRSGGNVKNVSKVIKTVSAKSTEHNNFPSQVLVELMNINKFDFLIQLLNEYTSHNIRISKVTAEDILERLRVENKLPNDQINNLHNSIKKITSKLLAPVKQGGNSGEMKHPREMSLNELQCHLIELEEKNLNPRGVLRRMLQLAVKENKLHLALELKTKCDELKVDLSPGMLASCFELYTKTKNPAEAKSTLNELTNKFPGFLIDEHKIIDFATVLIMSGQEGEAKRAIKVRANSKVIGLNNNKNIWNLLNALAERTTPEMENKAKVFLDLLVKLRYCSYDNTVLGPVIREWLIKGDLEKAIEEFLQIAKEHRKTPLNLELMTILVEIKNGKNDKFVNVDQNKATELLQSIIVAIEQIHGKTAAQTSLLFAMAEGGTENQVRKLLIDPNIRIDLGVFQKQCDYLCSCGKVEPLIKLAKASRGIGSTIVNEQQMYGMLMDSFSRENNFEIALKLFEKLSEDDEMKINLDFSRKLVELLQRNNLEIPTNLAMFNR